MVLLMSHTYNSRRLGFAMRNHKIKILIMLPVALCLVFLSGCLMRISADNLYRLPQISEDYLRLQAHINTVLSEGAEFSAPTGGPNRQSVQVKDLNGDGVDEVLAFFRITGYSALKIYIFERVDGDYSVAEVITGIGSAIESIRYVDMDGDGTKEIVVGWQLGDALSHMEIYSLNDFNAVLLQSAEYDGITIVDLNGDGTEDVLVVRLPSMESEAVAQIFYMTPEREVLTAQASLSTGIESFQRMMRGFLADGAPAVFVEGEGTFENGTFVTDILAFNGGVFSNISRRTASGVSDANVRYRRILSADINDDGVLKVPTPRRLLSPLETAYYAMDWFSFDSRGLSSLALTTYHNPTDEWFLILPRDWRGQVTVRREDVVSGERTVIFSHITYAEGPFEDFLRIFRLTGDAREERSRLPGRVRLLAEGTSVYAFEILVPPDSFGLTINEEIIAENFHLIFSDWLAGTI